MNLLDQLSEDQLWKIAKRSEDELKKSGTTHFLHPPMNMPIPGDPSEEISAVWNPYLECYEVTRHPQGALVAHDLLPAKANFVVRIKEELLILLCTEDKKYADLRREIDSTSRKSQTTIVSLIAAALTLQIGIVAAAIVPICAVVLIGILRLGKNAFCTGEELKIPTPSSGARVPKAAKASKKASSTKKRKR